MISFCEKIKFLFQKTYSIDDLKASEPDDLKKMKKEIQIMVIDDEDFSHLESLQKRGYHIDYRTDLTASTDAAEHQIIITDIRGVGKSLGGGLEGGAIVKEIKKLYPEKYVIVYSASQFDVTANAIFQAADECMKKDSDLETWVDTIDEGIKAFYDPKKIWHKTRANLIAAGISSYTIVQIESHFVTSIKNKKNLLSQSFSNDDSVLKLISPLVQLLAFLVK